MAKIECWHCGKKIDEVWGLRGCPYCKADFEKPKLYTFEEIKNSETS